MPSNMTNEEATDVLLGETPTVRFERTLQEWTESLQRAHKTGNRIEVEVTRWLTDSGMVRGEQYNFKVGSTWDEEGHLTQRQIGKFVVSGSHTF
jgi:hypothetical protein